MATNISTISINASPERIWEVITEPAMVKQWQYGSDLVTDWEIGSEIRFRTEWQDKIFEQWGKVLEVIPNRSVQYTLFAPRPGIEDKPENYFIMHYVLTPGDTFTTLEIIQHDNRPGAVQEAPQGEENPILQSLKKIAETNSP